MILENSRQIVDGKPVPMIKGKIQMQSEAAEVFYKDIRIRNIETYACSIGIRFSSTFNL